MSVHMCALEFVLSVCVNEYVRVSKWVHACVRVLCDMCVIVCVLCVCCVCVLCVCCVCVVCYVCERGEERETESVCVFVCLCCM